LTGRICSSREKVSPVPPHDLHFAPRGLRRIVLVGILATGAALAAWMALRPSPPALYERATRLAAASPDEAERLYRQAVMRAGGSFPDAQMQLGLLAARRQAWEETEKICDSLDWRAVRADLVVALGREAVAARNTTLTGRVAAELSRRPRSTALPALQELATSCRGHGLPAQELTCLELQTVVAPDDPRGWWQLARAYESRADPVAAATVYRHAGERDLPPRDRVEFQHRLVERLVDAGVADEARDELNRLMAMDDTQTARIQVHRAHLHRLDGDFRAALADLEKVWDQIREAPGAIRLRSILQLDAGEFDAARQGLEEVVAANPFDEAAHFKLAEACRRLGLAEESQIHRERHYEIQTRRQEVRRIKSNLDRAPPTRDQCLRLARLHDELGENEQAAYWFQAAREIR
jgi:tetratricopeptide (TPR) repeat protein